MDLKCKLEIIQTFLKKDRKITLKTLQFTIMDFLNVWGLSFNKR